MMTTKHFAAFALAAVFLLAGAPGRAAEPVADVAASDVRILGVSPLVNSTAGGKWWDAAGKPVEMDPVGARVLADQHFMATSYPLADDHRGVVMLIEVKNIAKEQDCSIKITGDNGFELSHDESMAEQPDHTRIYVIRADFRTAIQTAAIRVGVTDLGWRDVVKTGSDYGPRWSELDWSKTEKTPDDKQAVFAMFSPISQIGEDACVTVTYPAGEEAIRVAGADAQGRVLPPESRGFVTFNGVMQRTVVFPKTAPNTVKGLTLQARPFHWQEFPKTPLQAGQ